MIKYNVTVKLLYHFFFASLLTANTYSADWYTNEDMTTFYEAINKISSNSFYLDSKVDLFTDMLKQYIYAMDPYGEYFTKEEYTAFQKTLSPDYAGVGMLLYQQNKDAKILCIPLTQKLKNLGVSKYDELISVNGRLVKNRNFYLISSWIRGRKNTQVTFVVKKISGVHKTITVQRENYSFQSAKRIIKNGIPMIQIVRFMNETPSELQRILNKWPKHIPIVIDLKGNGGGDFFAAIQSADLLLPIEALITTIETKNKIRQYQSFNKDISDSNRVILLQDKFSASAAEVFIAALTQNHRAESIGEKSFGKAVAQKIIPLEDGSALLLTYGKIITPNGKSYHKKGLLPTSSLSLSTLLDRENSF